MSVDALQIYVILHKEMCATHAILSPWELMRYYLIMSHTKDLYQLDKWRNSTLECGFKDLGKFKVIGNVFFLLRRERTPNFYKCIRLLHQACIYSDKVFCSFAM